MRRVLVLAAIVLAVLVAADRIAVSVADRVVASRIERDQGLSSRPDVSIHGFPFLTQAVGGHYDDVTLTLHNLHRAVVPVHRLTVDLAGVHVPLGSVLSGHVSSVPVDRATATILLSYRDLNAFFGSRHLVVSDGGNGEVKVTASATVLGHTVGASGRARIDIHDSDLEVVIGNGLDLTIPLGGLPFRMTLIGAKATKSGVSVSANANGLVLHPRS